MNTVSYIVIAILIFISIFVFLRLYTLINYKMHGDEEISIPLKYIKNKYKLSVRERKSKRLRLWLDLVNTIAITIPVYIVLFLDLKINKIFIYGLSLIKFIILLLVGYNIIGIIEKRRENK